VEYIQKVFSTGAQGVADLIFELIGKIVKEDEVYLLSELPIALFAKMVDNVGEIYDVTTALKTAFTLGTIYGVVETDKEARSVIREFANNMVQEYLIGMKRRFRDMVGRYGEDTTKT